MKILILLMLLFVTAIANAGDKFNKMTSAEHLKYAKQAIEGKHLEPAKLHLDAISPSAYEYKEAIKLRNDIRILNEKITKNAQQQASVQKRYSFAAELETKLREMGVSSTIAVRDQSKTTLHIKSVVDSDRELIFKLVNEQLTGTMKHIGFKTVIINDGGTFNYKMKL